MSGIFAAACSIASTRRRRFLWAAWWTAPPTREPFRKPDASQGGARSREEALAQAQRAAGRPLVEIDGRWARAWSRVLVGALPWTEKQRDAEDGDHPLPPRQSAKAAATSIWQILDVPAQATLAEIKRAFRKHALATHPDRGGDPALFRAIHAAYAEACKRRERSSKRPAKPTNVTEATKPRTKSSPKKTRTTKSP